MPGRPWHSRGMRTFQIRPTSPGQHLHHMWVVVGIGEDGTETVIETYATMPEADTAKAEFEQSEMINRR